ncbi:MAG: hypothetical protein O2779_00840 [Nanoarchaeota archaeon]|nr:hypothetical protein [Nanoarchaeota archaeon]
MKTIQIPQELLAKIEVRAKEANFTSAEDYVVYILRKVLEDSQPQKSKKDLEAQEDEIRKNLKDMGYID